MFQNAEGYERMMGRWSRRLAPLLIGFGGLSDGDRVVDVGCGTGSLTFTLSQLADIAAATGIDISEGYIEYARSRNTDGRLRFEGADACALPFADRSFDRAFSLLVLQFVPDPARVVAEMRRVVRPDGRWLPRYGTISAACRISGCCSTSPPFSTARSSAPISDR